MVKRLLFFTALVSLVSQVFGAAQMQSLSVSGGCYTPGQYITVSFEARVGTASNWINADVVFSGDAVREYGDDAVVTSDGSYDDDIASPVTAGHEGYYVLQPNDTEWYPVEFVVKVPAAYTGSYYVFVAVRETDPVTLSDTEDLYDLSLIHI